MSDFEGIILLAIAHKSLNLCVQLWSHWEEADKDLNL